MGIFNKTRKPETTRLAEQQYAAGKFLHELARYHETKLSASQLVKWTQAAILLMEECDEDVELDNLIGKLARRQSQLQNLPEPVLPAELVPLIPWMLSRPWWTIVHNKDVEVACKRWLEDHTSSA
jgi:hypothetical protein